MLLFFHYADADADSIALRRRCFTIIAYYAMLMPLRQLIRC